MSGDLLREAKRCECGCGELAPIATSTDARRGDVKGQPKRFIRGHSTRLRDGEDESVRFWRRVNKSEGCWTWTGGLARGYGHFQSADGRHVGAHRWAWESTHGPIPGDLTVDHLCRNKVCVNPTHMELVTRGENARRGQRAVIEGTCSKGHQYVPENTYVTKQGWRQCRTCHRERQRAA